MKKNMKTSFFLLGPAFLTACCLFGGCAQPHTEKKTVSMSVHLPDPTVAIPRSVSFNEGTPPESETKEIDHIDENPFLTVKQHPFSTFPVNVNNASYANIRRFIRNSILPPKDMVRIEEMVNYFDYDLPPPGRDMPFSILPIAADCPWNGDHRLVSIGIRGMTIDESRRPDINLVFLLDVSGSMHASDKLPLLKQTIKLLTTKLREKDRIAITVYAGATGLVLPSTPCSAPNKALILKSLENLQAGGSAHGSEGIHMAYTVAQQNLIPGGINRVILATDGDFDLGIANRAELLSFIKQHAENKVSLTVLGFGAGNIRDVSMEELARTGKGNYGYIDNILEARKLLVDQLGASFVTVAGDVKIQIEFNPAQVQAYRLIGYENRMQRPDDFNDDQINTGEIGAGQTVNTLYEIVPVLTPPGNEKELMTIKLQYKKPSHASGRLISLPISDTGMNLAYAGPDFRFAAAVAAFGMLLQNSPHKGTANYDHVIDLARTGLRDDLFGYRAECINLMRQAKELSR